VRLLVTGAGGMLGCDVMQAAGRAGDDTRALTHHDLDVADARAVADALGRWREHDAGAGAVLNCAAFTNVDAAESEREAALAVNGVGAGNLARVAAELGLPMLHVSSDYVFSGSPNTSADGDPRPYLERDPTGPLSVYGQSKLAGEQEVLAASPRHLVVRSSWLFGVHGPNFAATMLRLARERESVAVVEDQIGCPTWTGHLAPALVGLVAREVSGLVHLAGAGQVSWNGFAREIFRQAEVACEVLPSTTAAMARPAPRPAYSALESERDEVLPLPPWQDGLAGFLAARAGMMRA
jgi:dTDP-4-dehydrorhamnose reductase